jgi:hypothetical protein
VKVIANAAWISKIRAKMGLFSRSTLGRRRNRAAQNIAVVGNHKRGPAGELPNLHPAELQKVRRFERSKIFDRRLPNFPPNRSNVLLCFHLRTFCNYKRFGDSNGAKYLTGASQISLQTGRMFCSVSISEPFVITKGSDIQTEQNI